VRATSRLWSKVVSSLRQERRTRLALAAFELSVVVPVLGLLTFLLVRDPASLQLDLILWIVVTAGVELVPVPFWRGLQISMGFPLLLAAGLLFAPPAAAVVAFVGSFDPREFRREITFLRALFNRCQVALSVLAASAVFHALATVDSPWLVVLPAAILAAVVDYVVNFPLVASAVSIAYGESYVHALKSMRIGRSVEFFVNYVGLGFVGTALAKLYADPYVHLWSLPSVLMPLMFARQMFFRSRALEEAHKELQDREQVMRALSDRMAEERQDERAQIAAYLHDDLAQLLFRLSLQVDVAKRHLRAGDGDRLDGELDAIRETKNRTSELVRALIRDLHRSPLGRSGLAEALTSFTADVGEGSGVVFHTDVQEVALPPAIQLLIYHIAREAVMNSLKHSGATNVWIDLADDPAKIVLSIQDDGVGFDSSGPGPEGHFGLTMMRERAQVAGGTFSLQSASGQGVKIEVQFPKVWNAADLTAGAENGDRDLHPVAEPSPARSSVSA
jgi:signal transduction histidine kinase